MTPQIVLVMWTSVVWYLLSIVVFGVSLLLTILILIQDSKETGLTSAFGGGGGSALLGARMQKDLAKFTAILAGILVLCLFVMGFLTQDMRRESLGGAAGARTEASKEADPGDEGAMAPEENLAPEKAPASDDAEPPGEPATPGEDVGEPAPEEGGAEPAGAASDTAPARAAEPAPDAAGRERDSSAAESEP